MGQIFLYNRYEKAVHAQEETEESLKRRPMSAGEPEMPSQVYSKNSIHLTVVHGNN